MLGLHPRRDMKDDPMYTSNCLYMEEEDVYAYGEQSELEKAIYSDVVKLEPQHEDVYIETQQSVVDEAQNSDVDSSEDAYIFEESDNQYPKDCNEAQTPHIGMNFLNWEDAYSFYNGYARFKGFSVRKGRTDVSKKRELNGSSPKIFSKKFVCYKEGFRWEGGKKNKGMEVRHRSEVRVGCPAFLSIKPNSNGWVVNKFEPNHNHPLVLENQSIRLRSHQQLANGVKGSVDTLHSVGIGQTQVVDAAMECFGDYNNVGAAKGTISHLKRIEMKMIEVDLHSVLAYFKSMKERDPRFIYSINVSDNQSVRGIFWVDAKGRSDYEVFGDVVVFDTVYKKNQYRWLFCSFTGVNHHAQSILFGCGLVANETKESFEWLFRVWFNAMGDKAPKAFITNECTSILPAVASVFPETVHRFCAWHFSKHVQEHLGPLWFRNPEFKTEWNHCVYHSRSEADFLTRWEAMIVKYNLTDHKWLNDKFSQKKFWVPCYLRGTFFAGMSMTQRSEGMNSYFRGYFKGSMTLIRFVKQYERVVTRRREKEADEELKSIIKLPQLESQSPIELHGRLVYTRRVFEIFKKNFSASLSLSAIEESFEGSLKKFMVGPFKVPIEHRCVVEYNSIGEEIHCSCLMFEFVGIPCKHFLKVLQMVDLESIPFKYILPRWTKEAKSGLSDANTPYNAPTTTHSGLLWSLTDIFGKILAAASSSKEYFDFALGTLQELNEKLINMKQARAVGKERDEAAFGTQNSIVEPNIP